MNQNATKLSFIRQAAAKEDWEKAILLASKFGDLGQDRNAILSAREAINRPAFQVEMKRDPQALIAAGIAALKSRYKL